MARQNVKSSKGLTSGIRKGGGKIKKGLIVAVIGVLIALFFAFDLQHQLTLDNLKAQATHFEQWQQQSPQVVAPLYFILYVLVAALSLPGAAILTLAAGALFGLFYGFILVSFASSIGALLAFLVSRYLLRDWVQIKLGDRLSTLNSGIEKEGAFYLFTLRLVPIFPFFLINLLMGLTPIAAFTFYWVSQIGMLAGTLVYVNAGTQLAHLDSLSGILSPTLILSFALLGIFPLIAKKVVGIIQAKRVYARWQKPKQYDRNLIVIGAGAAGLVTAYIGAAVKAKVTLVEAHKMGGDCLNFGCVPSKALIRSAKLAHQIKHADRYGLTPPQSTDLSFSFKAIMKRVHEIIKAIEPHDSVERYESLGVEVLSGYATLKDPWTVSIAQNSGETVTLTARSIVIAAGAKPFVPPLPGIEASGYVTSDTLWDRFSDRDTPPARLIVLGGGPIGCELAQSFARLGSEVTQIEMAPRLLIREDEEVAEAVRASMSRDGVNILTGHKALRCEQHVGDNSSSNNNTNTKVLIVEHNGEEISLPYDEMICAVGRVARLEGYGLETLGIETSRTVVTNEYLETLYPNIYAAGDVAGPYQFTHTAAHQAWYASVNALFGFVKKFAVDYRVIPWTTFTDPEVARVGLSEQEAKERGIPYEVSRYGLDDLDRAITDSEASGFIKVLTKPNSDRILGATIIGEHAGDLLAECVFAMKHGLGLNKILGTIHTYPTWNEANRFVAGEWKRAHTNPTVMRLLTRLHAWRRG